MSTPSTNVTSRTVMKSYPPPPELSMTHPHVGDVFAKPSKQGRVWRLKFNCQETGAQPYYEPLENQFIKDPEIHDYLGDNLQILPVSFRKWWKRKFKCNLPSRNDVIYDHEDRTIFVLEDVTNNATHNFIHPYHRDRIIIITGNKVDLNDTLSGANITIENKMYELSLNYISVIGNIHSDNIKLLISKKALFSYGDDRLHKILSKKFESVPKPTKNVKKVKVSDDFSARHWDNYLHKHLTKHHVNWDPSRSVIKFKLRTQRFQSVFPFIKIQNEDQYRNAYLDYFDFKISLRTSRISVAAVFLKQDKISGFIQGEDLIPNPF